MLNYQFIVKLAIFYICSTAADITIKNIVNTLIANHAISCDASSHQTAKHALSHGRYQVSKNSITATTKQCVIFILATREGIDKIICS